MRALSAALSENMRSIDPVVVEYLKCKGHLLERLVFEANPNIMKLLSDQSSNINAWCPNLYIFLAGQQDLV